MGVGCACVRLSVCVFLIRACALPLGPPGSIIEREWWVIDRLCVQAGVCRLVCRYPPNHTIITYNVIHQYTQRPYIHTTYISIGIGRSHPPTLYIYTYTYTYIHTSYLSVGPVARHKLGRGDTGLEGLRRLAGHGAVGRLAAVEEGDVVALYVIYDLWFYIDIYVYIGLGWVGWAVSPRCPLPHAPLLFRIFVYINPMNQYQPPTHTPPHPTHTTPPPPKTIESIRPAHFHTRSYSSFQR